MKKRTNNIHPLLERLDSIPTRDGSDVIRDEFSPYRCECCGSLPGERYQVHAWYWNKRSRIGSSRMRGTFSVCPECIYLWQ